MQSDRLAPQPRGVVRLRVASGLHAGASIELPPGQRSVLGAATEAAISVFDTGIAPAHLAITTGADARRVHLVALEDGVRLATRSYALRAGATIEVSLPITLFIASTEIRLDANAKASRTTFPRPRLPVAAAVLLGVGVLGLPAALFGVPRTVASAVASPGATPLGAETGSLVPAPLRVTAPAAAPVPRPAAPDPLAELRDRVAALGLTEIEFARPEPGLVVAQGEMDPARLADWRAAQQWFDARFGGRISLANGVKPRTARGISFTVDAVWSGPNPNVIINGQKYFEEAALPDGWVLERVEPTRLLLRRGSQRLAVAY